MSNVKIDVVIGLTYGDEGKGKISHALLKHGNATYTHALRWNGGGNAGHTIYHEGKKFVTHQIPSGVFHGIRSIVGPGCVINPKKFLEEVDYLTENLHFKLDVGVAKNAHIVRNMHVFIDETENKIGTTKTGNGPAYTDKYARKGERVENNLLMTSYAMDMYEEFYTSDKSIRILAEGAQGFNLDIDWGDYPYVTSSHCGIGGILNNGFNHQQINHVFGVIKAYDTYVGSKPFQPIGNVFDRIVEAGQEYGATTGRKRQVNWLNWNYVIRGIEMNGVNTLIINKGDILDVVGCWNILHNGETLSFSSKKEFQEWLYRWELKLGVKIIFSESADDTNFLNRL